MLVKEIFDHLAQGELRALSIGGMDDGGVLKHNYEKIIPHINMGIIEIYKRLSVETKIVSIQCDPSIREYELKTDFTQTAGTAPLLYILDSEQEPFLGDILRIEGIRGETLSMSAGKLVRNSDGNFGKDYLDKSINDSSDALSIHTNYLSFRVPEGTKELLEVTYRSKLPNIVYEYFDADTSEINLPYVYLAPLLSYIGMRITIGLPPKEGVSDSNIYLGAFEAGIAQIIRLGLVTTDNTTNYKAVRNGWC